MRKSRKQAQGRPVGRADSQAGMARSQDAESRAGPEPIKPGNCTREGTTRLQRAGRDRNLKSPVAVPERIYYPQGIATELTKEISPPRQTTIGSGHRPPGTARRALPAGRLGLFGSHSGSSPPGQDLADLHHVGDGDLPVAVQVAPGDFLVRGIGARRLSGHDLAGLHHVRDGHLPVLIQVAEA